MSEPDYLISTPENVDLHLELAGLGNRIMACIIDTGLTYAALIMIALVCLFCLAAVEFLPFAENAKPFVSLALIGLAIMVSLFVYFGYYIFFEGRWGGQTPGKRVAHIRVIEQTGQPVTWASVFIRNLLRVVDMGLALIGLVVMLVDRNERRLGDLASGTIVIREQFADRNSTQLLAHVDKSIGQHLDVGRLTPREYELLLSFMQRRHTLSKQQRPLIAKRLESYFRDKLSEPADGDSPEFFLEKILSAYQARADQSLET